MIAKDVISFMAQNPQYHSTMIHGFSVGGYLWGEVLGQLQKMPERQNLVKNICGQIWDSPVDFEVSPHNLCLTRVRSDLIFLSVKGIPTGLPGAVFPNNSVLRASLEKYMR